ncbi:hypothetical protein [Ehrlichia muris]|uniref:Uncharacterized protein n=1 Tax=Ehrlichia muris AS145 TaxID=1423892 RepID=V9R7H4_9RICK|nr:hypothetical protein [Ehrlichia muris]AHC39735.1 hypothetical protein EMUR_03745 [Ehrlichia muris AS145]
MKLNDYEQVILLTAAILVLLALLVFFIVKLLCRERISVINESTAAQGQEDLSDYGNSSVYSWESALSHLDNNSFYETHFSVGIKEDNGTSQVASPKIIEMAKLLETDRTKSAHF